MLKSDPNEFVTTIGPDVAPTGTTAVNEVELTPVTEVIVLRPIFTELTPSRPTPEMVMTVPAAPDVGEIDVMDGAAVAVELQVMGELTAISVGFEETGAAAAGTK